MLPNLTPPQGLLICTLAGHTEGVDALAVAPDGKRVVSAASDHTLKVWDLETGATLLTLHGHEGPVTAVAITPDGLQAISGSWDGTVRSWDLTHGTLLLTLRGHASGVNAVAVSPDGRRVISGGGPYYGVGPNREPGTLLDYTLRVWDLETGTELLMLSGHTDRINAIAITPDGRRAISAAGRTLLHSVDNTLKVWDLETGAVLNTLTGHIGPVVAVAITPDSRYIVSAGGCPGSEPLQSSRNKVLKVWDIERGSEMRTINSLDQWPGGGGCP